MEQARQLAPSQVLLGIVPVLIASFAYPLGNRKMMELCGGQLDVFQRILGMTLASLPFWLAVALYGMADTGLPSSSQVGQSVIVALSSGIVATVLFFRATDLVRDNMSSLAAVEATQSLEVLFALLGRCSCWPRRCLPSCHGRGLRSLLAEWCFIACSPGIRGSVRRFKRSRRTNSGCCGASSIPI